MFEIILLKSIHRSNAKFCGSVKKWLKFVLTVLVCVTQCGVNLSFAVQYLCLPVTTHLDHGITQICINMWPDFSESCSFE